MGATVEVAMFDVNTVLHLANKFSFQEQNLCQQRAILVCTLTTEALQRDQHSALVAFPVCHHSHAQECYNS